MTQTTITEADAQRFATEWIQAWNAHDLDAIMSHYAAEITLTSPIAARLLNAPKGEVKGKAALRQYFERGLKAYPNLKFELHEVMWGLSSIVLIYSNQHGKKSAEFMEIDPSHKITRVIANYNG